MTGTTTSNSDLLRPEDVAALLVRSVQQQSVAAQVATVVTTGSHSYRIPIVTDDPAAGWFAEGSEITPDDITTDEVTVTPSKVAGLSIITRELAQDSDPAATDAVGQGLARDIARKVDAAFFGNATTNGPSGLGSLTTSTATDTNDGAFGSVDAFIDAVFAAADETATITSFVANSTDAKVLAKLKQSSGSNVPLLQPDPTQPARSMINGVPLYVSSAVTAGTIWAIPADRVFLVVRDDARIETDSSVYFTSDRVAVKATMRVGFGFPHPKAIVKLGYSST